MDLTPEINESDSHDQIAHDLHELRRRSGMITFAEIVRRIGAHRLSNGVPAEAARPARTTVYDAFKKGRRRISPKLVGEISRALGANEEEVTQWEERCSRVQQEFDASRKFSVTPDHEAVQLSEPEMRPVPATPNRWRKTHFAARSIFLAICLAFNFLGYAAVDFFRIPLYIDSVGTGVCALVLGPWYGLAVGVATNLLGYAIHGPIALPFALQSAAFAFIWGYGARRFHMTTSLGSYFKLTSYVSLSHLFIAIPLGLMLFGGGTGHAGDVTFHRFLEMGLPLVPSVYLGHMIIAFSDALVVGFLMLTFINFMKSRPLFVVECEPLFPFLDSKAELFEMVGSRVRSMLAFMNFGAAVRRGRAS